MKIKTFRSTMTTNLDKKVNEFIMEHSIEVIELKFSSSIFDNSVMVIYKEKI